MSSRTGQSRAIAAHRRPGSLRSSHPGLRLALCAPVLLAACAHAAQPKPRSSREGPSREAVVATMNELSPRIVPCVPEGRRFLQVKLTLDGYAGVITEANVLPESQLVCKGDMNHSDVGASCASSPERGVRGDASDRAVVECVRRATVGRAAPTFEGSSFHLSFPVHAASEHD